MHAPFNLSPPEVKKLTVPAFFPWILRFPSLEGLYQVRIITYNSLLPCNLLLSLLPSALCLLPFCNQSISIQLDMILGVGLSSAINQVSQQSPSDHQYVPVDHRVTSEWHYGYP